MTRSAPFNPDISPPSFKNHLIRTHLLRQLQASPKKLTLIQAPPGYGKTSFLKQVHDYLKTPSVWLNLRDSDNDPVSLRLKCASALSALSNEASELQQSNGFTPPSLALWSRSLIDAMNAHAQLNVFLNDVDFVSEPKSLEFITTLLHMSHPGVRIYVTVSSTVNFAYANLLMENQVASINQESLRFSPEDIQGLFTMNGRALPSENVAQKLADVSEGWPAAGNFAANALATDDDILRFVNDAGIKQQAFDRYFIERVFEQQSADVQALLLRLCLLDRFNLALCHELADHDSQSQEFWQYVQQHTFITPIDASGQWFRFHQLFSLFLRHRCQVQFTQSLRSTWQLKAGHWFKQQHQLEEAIALVIQAGQFEEAAQWMEAGFSSVVVRLGKHVTYLAWYDALPESFILTHPRLRIGYIWAMLANRQFLSVAEQIQWLLQHQSQFSEVLQREIRRITALIHCTMEGLKDNASTAAPLAERWLQEWDNPDHYTHTDDHHYETGLALLIKGYCAKCLSDFTTAREALHQSNQHFAAYGTFYGQTWAKSLLAVTYAKQGFHHEAQREALEGYQLARQKLGEKSHNGFGLAALLAAISYEHDDIEPVRNYLKDILPYLKEQSPTDLLVAAFETQARLMIYDGAHEEAFGFLKDGMKWAESQNLKRLQFKLLDELIVNLVRHNRVADAERYASEYDLILRDADEFEPQQPCHNIAARSVIYMLWHREAYNDVGEILNILLARSQTRQHLRRSAEWQKLTTMNLAFQGKSDDARIALQNTLKLACTQNYLRLILDEPRLLPLLRKLEPQIQDSDVKGFHQQLIKRLPAEETPANTLVEPLTGKEIEIIKRLADGQPNKAIAEQLFISVGTLKWHLHNIYAKLQVKNRTQALVEGRKQGYL